MSVVGIIVMLVALILGLLPPSSFCAIILLTKDDQRILQLEHSSLLLFSE